MKKWLWLQTDTGGRDRSMELSILAVILGFILDLIVGDPHWLYQPIRLVGHLISGLEKNPAKSISKNRTRRTDSRSIPVDPHSWNHIGSQPGSCCMQLTVFIRM